MNNNTRNDQTVVNKSNRKKVFLWILGGMMILLIADTVLTSIGYDYADLTWTEAFELMHTQASKKYPFR